MNVRTERHDHCHYGRARNPARNVSQNGNIYNFIVPQPCVPDACVPDKKRNISQKGSDLFVRIPFLVHADTEQQAVCDRKRGGGGGGGGGGGLSC